MQLAWSSDDRASGSPDAPTRIMGWEPPLFVCALLLLIVSSSATPYKYLSYAEMTTQLHALASSHAGILRVYSAQERFNLPHVGHCNTTDSSGSLVVQPCTIWVAELTEYASLEREITRAEMLVSGEVHGDEVVGPQAVMAFIRYMVEAHKSGDAFARRMVSSRIVTLLPMTNAIGYELGVREEVQSVHDVRAAIRQLRTVSRHGIEMQNTTRIDPNRDFAFDQHPLSCMRTVAARVINELMRERLFRVMITFHGGTNVIGYEWGDTQHCETRRGETVSCALAPDDAIMVALAERMREVAGKAGKFEPEYKVGTMGELVYPVHGGMEDWMYGASWSGEGVTCTPKTLGGYAASKTQYTAGMTRVATFLIETGMLKRPSEALLGGDTNVLERGAVDDGHVPRNVRLLAAAMDALEPYIELPARDRVPFSVSTDHKVSFRWVVGGAFIVDGTYLQWGVKGGHNGVTEAQRGHSGAPGKGTNATIFEATVPFNTPEVPHTGALYVRAAAVADNSMDVKVAGCSPSVLPQSHLLAARARSDWKHRVESRVVISQRVVFSQTLRIEASEGFVAVSVDNKVRWGAGTGRVPAPSRTNTLRTLYPRWHRAPSGTFEWPWSELKRVSTRSWLALLAFLTLTIIPCVVYRNRLCCKPHTRLPTSDPSAHELEDGRDPFGSDYDEELEVFAR